MLTQERSELVAAGCRLTEQSLVIGTGGNVSARCGDHVLISPTGASLGELTQQMLTLVDLDGAVVDGELAPTSELPLHLAIYRNTDARAVAHAHAPACIAVSNAHDELPAVHYTAVALGGPVRVAPYATYGTGALAAGVLKALDGRVAALMRHHGCVAYGTSITQACERLELLEWLAELYSRCAAFGPPATLSEQELLDVVTAVLATGYGNTRPIGETETA